MFANILLVITILADPQGYTPYGYGMDTPVRVRNTVSYGRGWQFLRSRGAGSNMTGACDPPQHVGACSCSVPTAAVPNDVAANEEGPMPRCVASPLCSGAPGQETALPPRTAIVLVLDVNASNLRFFFGPLVLKAYGSQVALLVRLVQSLRAVGTSLPIHLLASGFRVPEVEERFASMGVRVLPADAAPPLSVPDWASKWARASFAKIRVLALEKLFDRVIVRGSGIQPSQHTNADPSYT